MAGNRIGRRRGLTVTALRAVVAYAISFILITIDPFSFSATLDRVGRNAFYKVMAPTFDQNEVAATVVIVDDAFLTQNRLYWPAPYLVHAELLRAIESYSPSSLFIDIVFIDAIPDPTLPNFIAALERIGETTPVFLAAASSETGAPIPIRPELQELVDRSEGVSLVSILYGAGQDKDRAYRLRPDADGRPSAAAAVYQAVCGSTPEGCEEIDTGVDLDLVWPLPDAATCAAVSGIDPDCSRISHNPLLRLARLSVGGVLGGLAPRALTEPNPVTTLGVPSVSASALAQGAFRDQLTPLLQDRAVFYGANLALNSDLISSPVNGDAPGVFAHATAFANLKVFGSRFVRAEPPLGMPATAHVGLLLALAIVTAYAVEAIAIRRGLPPSVRVRLEIFDLLFLSVVVTAIEYGLLRSGPANWWAVFSAVAVSRWVVDRMRVGGHK